MPLGVKKEIKIMGKFVIRETATGFKFDLKASNGEVIATSEVYSSQAARRALDGGSIVVFGGGLGIPFLSTDTTVAVRAAEVGADAVLMAKSVDYIYDADPKKNPDAKPIKEIRASEVLAKNLQAVDSTATAFCLSTGMPVKLFGLNSEEDIKRAIIDGKYGTVIIPE